MALNISEVTGGIEIDAASCTVKCLDIVNGGTLKPGTEPVKTKWVIIDNLLTKGVESWYHKGDLTIAILEMGGIYVRNHRPGGYMNASMDGRKVKIIT